MTPLVNGMSSAANALQTGANHLRCGTAKGGAFRSKPMWKTVSAIVLAGVILGVGWMGLSATLRLTSYDLMGDGCKAEFG